MSEQTNQPEIDICADCGEHAEFGDEGSECCGAGAINTDPDLEER